MQHQPSTNRPLRRSSESSCYHAAVRVFLSYHQKDDATAAAIRKVLEREHFEVWDPQDLLPGEDWHKASADALRSSQAIVILLSPDAVASPRLKQEVSYALGESRFEGRLIPVVVRKVPKIPWILERLQVLDIHPDVKRGSQRIVEALKRKPSAA